MWSFEEEKTQISWNNQRREVMFPLWRCLNILWGRLSGDSFSTRISTLSDCFTTKISILITPGPRKWHRMSNIVYFFQWGCTNYTVACVEDDYTILDGIHLAEVALRQWGERGINIMFSFSTSVPTRHRGPLQPARFLQATVLSKSPLYPLMPRIWKSFYAQELWLGYQGLVKLNWPVSQACLIPCFKRAGSFGQCY